MCFLYGFSKFKKLNLYYDNLQLAEDLDASCMHHTSYSFFLVEFHKLQL